MNAVTNHASSAFAWLNAPRVLVEWQNHVSPAQWRISVAHQLCPLSPAQRQQDQLQSEHNLAAVRQHWPQARLEGHDIFLHETHHHHSNTHSPALKEPLHKALFQQAESVHLIWIGPGQVGQEGLRQWLQADLALRLQHGLALEVQQVINSRGSQWLRHGEGPKLDSQWQLQRPLTGKYAQQAVVIIDTTAAPEVAAQHGTWLAQGAGVVTANKHALSGSLAQFRQWFYHPCYAASTTVGAGLPFISTLADPQTRPVNSFEAILSGSINALLHQMEQGDDFHQALKNSQELGLLEPDPSADLDGWDSARKLLILGRILGLSLELNDIQRQPLMADFTHPEAIKALGQRITQARSQGECVRYVARLKQQRLQLALENVSQHHPLAIKGCHNLLKLSHPQEQQTLLSGPGAGPVVTAAGVLRDIRKVATTLCKQQQQSRAA